MTDFLRKRTGITRILADLIESSARDQIRLIETHPAFSDFPIAIMPDVHAGKGCVVGFTGKFQDAVIASIVGVDIGCGVAAFPLGSKEIDFPKFDAALRTSIPIGFHSHPFRDFVDELPSIKKRIIEISDLAESFLVEKKIEKKVTPIYQIGTLGGGNHFVEIDEGPSGRYLTVHSGSRNFGLTVANFFQEQAKKFCENAGIRMSTGLEYLPMKFGGDEYMKWLNVAQEYAKVNRRAMIHLILNHLGVRYEEDKIIESVHNYISPQDHIIRKGAISAHKGEQVIIPFNMSDGLILGKGLGNEEYNFSAPHGSGRVFGRKDIMRRLDSGEFTMEAYAESMKGIFTTSISKATFDESKFAYKPTDLILNRLKETVEIIERLKPIYNLKARA